MNLADLRRDYAKADLDIADTDPDPIVQFRRWFTEAEQAEILEPNAMTLATATADGRPSARIVLLKGLSEAGFVFFTPAVSELGKNAPLEHQAFLGPVPYSQWGKR